MTLKFDLNLKSIAAVMVKPGIYTAEDEEDKVKNKKTLDGRKEMYKNYFIYNLLYTLTNCTEPGIPY